MKAKTELFVTLKDNQISLTPFIKTTTFNGERDKTTRSHVLNSTHSFDDKGNEIFKPVSIPIQNDACSMYTDLLFAVCEKYVPLITYTALKTSFSKSGHMTMYKLMGECVEYAKVTNTHKAIFEDWLATGETIAGYMPEKAKANDIANEVMYANEYKTMKESSYTMITDRDGKAHKVERLKTRTNKRSRFGMVVDNEIELAHTLEVEDLIQVGYTAVYELVRLGLVNDVFSFWNYKSYIYKMINKAIMSNRAFQIKAKDIETYSIKASVIRDSKQERMLLSVENKQTLKEIEKHLLDNLTKKHNKYNIQTTFRYVYVLGKARTDVAALLRVDEKQIRRYCDIITKTLNTSVCKYVLERMCAE